MCEYSHTKSESLVKIHTTIAEIQHFSRFFLLAHRVRRRKSKECATSYEFCSFYLSPGHVSNPCHAVLWRAGKSKYLYLCYADAVGMNVCYCVLFSFSDF